MASRVDCTGPTGVRDRFTGCFVGRAAPAGGHVIGGISEYAFVDRQVLRWRATPAVGHVDSGISEYALVYHSGRPIKHVC